MAFTINDMVDFQKILIEHPEWLGELRRVVLTQELLSLPELVRELVEAQKQTEARLQRLESGVVELVEAQKKTEQLLQQLILAQTRTDSALQRLDDRQNRLWGYWLHQKYVEHAHNYFGNWLRRVRVIWPARVAPDIEERIEEVLTEDEALELRRVDILVVGNARRQFDAAEPEVWLAVEVSAMIDRSDVTRAVRRAELLRKLGWLAVPVVAGEGLSEGATQLLQDVPVALLLDGRNEGWQEAFTAARQAPSA